MKKPLAYKGLRLRTVKVTYKGVKAMGTQEYDEEYTSGHYCLVMFNEEGDILYSQSTSAGAPKYKLEEKHLVEWIEEKIRRGELIDDALLNGGEPQ